MHLFTAQRRNTSELHFLHYLKKEKGKLSEYIQMDFQCNRLQSDNIKGTLSSVGLLPENRLLLFGTENGNIELLC